MVFDPNYNKRVRTILVKRGHLDQETAEKASRLAEEEKENIATVLMERHMVEAKVMLGALSQELDYPPVDLERVTVDPQTMDVLAQDMAEFYCVLPITKIGNILTLAVANPFDVLKLDDLQIVTGCAIRPVISHEKAIREAIKKTYRSSEEEIKGFLDNIKEGDVEEIQMTSGDMSEEDIDFANLTNDSEAPVVKLVNLVIVQAVRDKVSDIHIEPFAKRIRVRFRLDGVLRESFSPPKRLQSAIASRIKIMANLDIAERNKPQDGKFQIRVEGRQIDFRVSVLQVVHGEKVVMRILDASNLALSLESLGFEAKCLQDFKKAIKQPYGMVLVTGPTGSGKSTTLYSSIKEVTSVAENITTVEDPVEYELEGINQVPVSVKRGLTFAAALRSILRQDPDTVMIGEIRDLETIEIAVKAALTGHLVFSTLHTNDAPSAISRMIDMGVDPFMVASSTIMVAAQRLARKLCKECKEAVDVPVERLVEMGFEPEEASAGHQLFRPKGCPRCSEGYKGRIALLETMMMSENVKRLIIDGASAIEIKKRALEEGMITLRRAGLLNVMRGITSLEEIMRVTMADR